MKKILISRTDAIGDVILTLPMTGILKERLPEVEIHFLGRGYTLPILQHCRHIDHAFSMDDPKWIENMEREHYDVIVHVFPRKNVAYAALRADIPMRIGVSRRWYHLLTCNRLLHFSRRNADLHEARLNLKLLAPLVGELTIGSQKIHEYYGLATPGNLPTEIDLHLFGDVPKIILHPLSKGSAREWGLANFRKLAEMLLEKGCQVILTGTAAEKELYDKELYITHPSFLDLGGRLHLTELMSLIARCDALVAASTGPLHIAAALGIRAVGLYSPVRPIHPGRWAPLGRDVRIVTHNVASEIGKDAKSDNSIAFIPPERVLQHLYF